MSSVRPLGSYWRKKLITELESTGRTEKSVNHVRTDCSYQAQRERGSQARFIRRIATGTACEHDGHHFDEVLDMHNTGRSVHTDKAYASRQRRQMLQVLGFVDAMQRRAQPGQPLSECQKRRNQRIASKRARVEHAFAGIRHMGGKFVRTIGQARATVAMTMMAACYNMKRLASFLERGVDAFFKPATTKAQVRLQTAKA